MRAAAAALRKQGVAKIVVAVPVGAPETCREMELEVDETICVVMPASFHGVGQFYEDFSQTTDEEVRELLKTSYAMSDFAMLATSEWGEARSRKISG